MVTPLHIDIAMHYHCRTGQYEMVMTNETRRQYAEDLVRAGLPLAGGDSGPTTLSLLARTFAGELACNFLIDPLGY